MDPPYDLDYLIWEQTVNGIFAMYISSVKQTTFAFVCLFVCFFVSLLHNPVDVLLYSFAAIFLLSYTRLIESCMYKIREFFLLQGIQSD